MNSINTFVAHCTIFFLFTVNELDQINIFPQHISFVCVLNMLYKFKQLARSTRII